MRPCCADRVTVEADFLNPCLMQQQQCNMYMRLLCLCVCVVYITILKQDNKKELSVVRLGETERERESRVMCGNCLFLHFECGAHAAVSKFVRRGKGKSIFNDRNYYSHTRILRESCVICCAPVGSSGRQAGAF